MMKKNNWLLTGALTLGLLGAASSAFAAPPVIVNNLNSQAEAGSWQIDFGTGTVEWISTNGVDNSGCIKAVLSASATGNKEIVPRWNLQDKAISTVDYVTIEYDIMFDPLSGSQTAGGSYGNYQEVLRDAGLSWDSHWVGAVGPSYAPTWRHMKFAVPNNNKTFPYLSFVLQGGANEYSGDVIFYIDNIVITPFQNPLVFGAFTNQTEVASWTFGQKATLSFSSKDAGSTTPPGSLKVDVAYDSGNTGWQEGLAVIVNPFAPSRYTFAAFDLYVENPNNLTGFGIIQLFTEGWTSIGSISLNTNNVGKWTHYEIAIPASITSGQNGLRFQFGGGMTAPLAYYLDNVTVYKPIKPPTIGGFEKAGAPGVQVTMEGAGQWQREAIVTPADVEDVFWAVKTMVSPVTYTFTISDFPPPGERLGFEAHMYLVNGTTIANNELNGSADWNAADIFILRIENRANDVLASIQWKTNLPNANPPADDIYHPLSVAVPSAIGTWTLTFTNDTTGILTGPGLAPTNFTMPEQAVMENFQPSDGFIQWGAFKNDGANDGHNNMASATFSYVGMTNFIASFGDNFPGPTLTNNYVWRTTKASAVTLVPAGTAFWLNWTLPADGYFVQTAPSVTGPWNDANVTNITQRGASFFGAVPNEAITDPNQTYFRLIKPQ